MKLSPILLTLAASTLLAGDASVIIPPGRYQLVNADISASYDDNRGSHGVVMKMLWKIDTITGQTWHFAVSMDKSGRIGERWVETTEREAVYSSTNDYSHYEPSK